MTKTIRVATDVGGTFTDLLVLESNEATGESVVRSAKTDTTPGGYEEGVFDVMTKGGVAADAVDFLAHGTTVVINALTERTGVRVGLIATQGFRDTLEIARGNRPDFFNLHYQKPEPFVPRSLRRELPGRMDYRGREMQPIDLTPLPDIVADFQAQGVEAVAICFIHSYANPAHEQAALAELGRLWPEVSAISSHQITREWREYERTSTAVLSAYVQPVAERYLQRLDAGLGERDFGGGLYIMQSNCGVDSVDTVSRIPITMVESGPASGVWGAAELGRLIGEPNVLALDIGGTTAKCSLIENARVRIKTDYWIGRSRATAGYPVMVPVVDLVEIGNGGGSIAWVDDFGKLRVGPRSAGAMPGPAAYGRGGTEATTTDANLWLGRINRDYFCGGGAMHAVALAQELGVAKVVVPADASVFSAWGMMMSDLRRDDVVTLLVDLDADHADAIEAAFAETEERARNRFAAEGIDAGAVRLSRFGRFRYQNQEHTTEVPLGDGPVTGAQVAAIEAAFHETYEREYTYRLDAPVEMVGFHVVARVEIGKLTMTRREVTGRALDEARKGARQVDYALEGVREAAIYDGERLEPGMAFDGPAIVEDPGTTVVVHPGNHAEVDDFGNIRIHIRR